MFEHPLKNAYIGGVINISSDLRGATLAGLQAQGWTNISSSNGYTLNSSGLGIQSGGANRCVKIYKGIPDLSNRSLLTMRITGYATRNRANDSYRYNSYFVMGIFANTSGTQLDFFNNAYIGGTYSASGPTQPFKTGIMYWVSTVLSGGDSYGNKAGNVDMTVKINLLNGDVTYKQVSPNTVDLNATLNSTQLDTIKNLQYVGVFFGARDSSNISGLNLYTVDLTVE